MFTPPPSPRPSSSSRDSFHPSAPTPSLGLSPPENDSAFHFSRMPSKSPSPAPEATSPLPLGEAKKRVGRRILLFAFLLPAVLILSISLRHLMHHVSVLHPRPMSIARREPQAPASSSRATRTSTDTATATASSGLPTIPASVPAALPTPLPQPFDLTLSSNFSTQSCEAFFTDFIQDPDFRQCRAFSFLLNSSSGFLDAQHNLTLFDAILWATCNTPRSAHDCAATMDSFANRLTSACAEDLHDGNQAVLQAQIGFQSYTAMRTAACLADPSTNTYCYLASLAAPDPADVYFFALPLGTPLPPDVRPSCSPCVKSLLAVYAQYVAVSPGSAAIQAPSSSGNTTAAAPAAEASPLPALSKTYPAAARLAINQCGGTYASVAVAKQSSAALPHRCHAMSWRTVLLALLLACLTC